MTKHCERMVKRLILALRLCRTEPVPDATQFIVYRRFGPTNSRDTREFGRNGYGWRQLCKLTDQYIELVAQVYEALRCSRTFARAANWR